jgi:type IV secretion system protein TrbB
MNGHDRIHDMLQFSFGPHIMEYLYDDDVIEIMINADGRLWIERFGSGFYDTGQALLSHDVERIIRLVASKENTVCNAKNPIISAELPDYGVRFQGIMPPVVSSPVIAIRKKALRIFSLDDYVKQEILTANLAEMVKRFVQEKKNILIAGGAASGKTTFANAVLAEMDRDDERLIIIEDTPELQCKAKNSVHQRVIKGVAEMRDLVKASLRLRCRRLIIGEVLGGSEALEMVKAWNTGHPGGLCTVHANGLKETLVRLEQLIQEVVQNVPRHLIAEAVNVIIYIEKNGKCRRIPGIAEVKGTLEDGEYVLNTTEPEF